MGVYLPNMEMPENCYECPFAMEHYSTLYVNKAGKFRGDYCCVITHKALTSTKRSRFCPLVPVPPHGDLIDAQEEMRLMQSCDYDTYDDYHRAFDMLDNAPTIIPAEEGE